jgi:hypothetical protein
MMAAEAAMSFPTAKPNWAMAVWLVAAATVRADERPEKLAPLLVRAMDLDSQSLASLQRRAEAERESGNITREQSVCLFAVERAALSGALEENAQRELTVQEMRTAIDYFESPAGQKDVRIRRGFMNVDQASTQEYLAMRAFALTGAGLKLLTYNVLTSTAASSQRLNRRQLELWWECLSKPSKHAGS